MPLTVVLIASFSPPKCVRDLSTSRKVNQLHFLSLLWESLRSPQRMRSCPRAWGVGVSAGRDPRPHLPVYICEVFSGTRASVPSSLKPMKLPAQQISPPFFFHICVSSDRERSILENHGAHDSWLKARPAVSTIPLPWTSSP